jgi:hypothetical protein
MQPLARPGAACGSLTSHVPAAARHPPPTRDGEEPAPREVLEQRRARPRRLEQVCDQQRAVHAADRQHAVGDLAVLRGCVACVWRRRRRRKIRVWSGRRVREGRGQGQAVPPRMRCCTGRRGRPRRAPAAARAPWCRGAASGPPRRPGSWRSAGGRGGGTSRASRGGRAGSAPGQRGVRAAARCLRPRPAAAGRRTVKLFSAARRGSSVRVGTTTPLRASTVPSMEASDSKLRPPSPRRCASAAGRRWRARRIATGSATCG